MSRGSSNAAQTATGTAQGVVTSTLPLEKQALGGALGGYTNLLNQGLPESDLANMYSTKMGAAASPFQEAGQEAANRAARTGNAAGVSALQDQLAREKSTALAGAAGNVANYNAGLKRENTAAGLQGMTGIGNIYANQVTGNLGNESGLINAWTNADAANWWNKLPGELISAGGAVGAAALGA